MKNFLRGIVAAILLCSTALVAEPFVGRCVQADLEVVYSLDRGQWIMRLGDGSCWKLQPLRAKRKQSWHEWWNKTEPKEWELSEEFFFQPQYWEDTDKIQVYEAKDALFPNCRHLLVNQRTREKVFAELIPHGAEFVPTEDYARKVARSNPTVNSTVMQAYAAMGDFIILEDQSIWKLHCIRSKEGSWVNWWNGDVVGEPDQAFLSEIWDWKHKDKVRAYPVQFRDEQLYKKYKTPNPQDQIVLMENVTRGKMVYASPVQTFQFVHALQKQNEIARKQSYANGYKAGQEDKVK